MRIVRIKALHDELGMVMVFGEDDRLPQPVTVRDLETMRS